MAFSRSATIIVCLGTGCHAEDIVELRSVSGVAVERLADHPRRLLLFASKMQRRGVSWTLQVGSSAYPKITSLADQTGPQWGIGSHIRNGWQQYPDMVWGAKLAVCAARGGTHGHGALVIGIALLVKALPFARVGTATSCDGHGLGLAVIDFFFPSDAKWCKPVFETMGMAQ